MSLVANKGQRNAPRLRSGYGAQKTAKTAKTAKTVTSGRTKQLPTPSCQDPAARMSADHRQRHPIMHTRKAGTSDGRDTGTTRESLANNPYHQHCSLPSGPLRARTHSGHDSMHGKRGKGYTVANTHGPRGTRPTMKKKRRKRARKICSTPHRCPQPRQRQASPRQAVRE